MSITLDQITKRYRNTPVVNDVSLDVAEGEFFVLLGPSGSGKSTLLRAIAGLTGVEHGRIALRGRDVTHWSPRKREVGFVFQNYALFRHMTVAENIEFALRVRRVKAAARLARRKELLRLVALEGLDQRLPSELSGGQQQRVAVARALAHKPSVLLLDEPFGALDAKIREELRRTIRQVQRELKISTILVTHDQEEAFALADRIGVMNLGRLLEVGRPDELYARPATRFVATFLGAANLLLARQTPEGIRVGTAPVGVQLGQHFEPQRESEVVALLRPEEIALAPDREALNTLFLGQGVVESRVFTGAYERLRVRIVATEQTTPHHEHELAVLEVTRTQHEQRLFPVQPTQTVSVGVRRIHVLPTPLSSFTVFAHSATQLQALKAHPLLVDLSSRMKTRVAMQLLSSLPHHVSAAERTTLPGVAVIAAGATTLETVNTLLDHGATEIFILPSVTVTEQPQRVIIHWTGDAVRKATLAVAASVLRHVPAEATYLGILPDATPDNQKPGGVRNLLDARSEAQAVHGLEMRTELHFGEAVAELTRQFIDPPNQMLILGVTQRQELTEKFASLLHDAVQGPLLLVYRSAADNMAQRWQP